MLRLVLYGNKFGQGNKKKKKNKTNTIKILFYCYTVSGVFKSYNEMTRIILKM